MSRIEEPSWYVLFVLVMYPLAGAFRLARYNLQDDYRFFKGSDYSCRFHNCKHAFHIVLFHRNFQICLSLYLYCRQFVVFDGWQFSCEKNTALIRKL